VNSQIPNINWIWDFLYEIVMIIFGFNMKIMFKTLDNSLSILGNFENNSLLEVNIKSINEEQNLHKI
jgi:hypothetical protein